MPNKSRPGRENAGQGVRQIAMFEFPEWPLERLPLDTAPGPPKRKRVMEKTTRIFVMLSHNTVGGVFMEENEAKKEKGWVSTPTAQCCVSVQAGCSCLYCEAIMYVGMAAKIKTPSRVEDRWGCPRNFADRRKPEPRFISVPTFSLAQDIDARRVSRALEL